MEKSLIIRPAQLARELQVNERTIYNMESDGLLPRRKKIGKRAVGWIRSDIDKWLEERPDAISQSHVTK